MQIKVHILSCFAIAQTNVPFLKHLDSSGSTCSLYWWLIQSKHQLSSFLKELGSLKEEIIFSLIITKNSSKYLIFSLVWTILLQLLK